MGTSMNARLVGAIIVLVAAFSCFSGCVGSGSGSSVTIGMRPNQVREAYGKPDVILEAAGDQVRIYPSSMRMEYEWPNAYERIWFFLERDLEVRFEKDAVVGESPITSKNRERIGRVLSYKETRTPGTAIPSERHHLRLPTHSSSVE